jgi:hypothetical protein
MMNSWTRWRGVGVGGPTIDIAAASADADPPGDDSE